MGVEEKPMMDSEADAQGVPETPPQTNDAGEGAEPTMPSQTVADEAMPQASNDANPMPKADNSDIAPPAMQQSTAPLTPPAPTTAQEYDAHDAQFANDLATKQIHPEKVNQLWGKKDTLGKIGSLFGLILGGAGAGLTHGPNIVLEMMNKEIDRDLEAQKQNVTNKQNFLSMNYQHELQMAQAKHMAYENQLAGAQAGAIPSENALRGAQAEALNAQNAGLASYNRAKNTALLAAFNDLKDKNANNPAAQPALNTLGQAIDAQMKNNNAQAAGAQQINSAKQQQSSSQPVNLAKMQKMITVGKSAPEMPGAIPSQDVPALTKESQDVQENRNFAKIYDDSFKKLDSMAAAGAINKNARAAQVATLGAALARSTTGRYNAQEALTQADGMFPSITDWGGVRKEKYRKAMQYFQGNEAATPTLDRYGLKNPFPQYSFGAQQEKSAVASTPSAPIERTTQDGQVGLFDPKTRKFLGYKNQTGSKAVVGNDE